MAKDAKEKLQHAHPWVHRLWYEEQGGESKRPWGYAVCWSPDVTKARMEEFDSYMENVLFKTFSDLGFPLALQFYWTLQDLHWADLADS